MESRLPDNWPEQLAGLRDWELSQNMKRERILLYKRVLVWYEGNENEWQVKAAFHAALVETCEGVGLEVMRQPDGWWLNDPTKDHVYVPEPDFMTMILAALPEIKRRRREVEDYYRRQEERPEGR